MLQFWDSYTFLHSIFSVCQADSEEDVEEHPQEQR